MPSRIRKPRLNQQQAEFARLVASGLSATEAYVRAYPACQSRKAARTMAYRLMKHPLIAAYGAERAATAIAAVDEAVKRYAITAERVADAMARLAFTDLRQVADWRTEGEGKQRRQVVTIRDADTISDEAHAAISEVRHDPGGRVTVKLYNKREALIDLARLKGWIADKPVDQRNLVVLKVER
jgi:phage terminase small subunit